LEKVSTGEAIIKLGEIGDKFYIVLEGIVEIFKPKYIEISKTPYDYMILLNDIKEADGNELRYKRILEKNIDFFHNLKDLDIHSLLKEVEHMNYKQTFLMEEYEKMGEYGEGFYFGDIALIKKSVRNATIKAKENCVLLTIGKDDYGKAIMEFQRRKLSKDIDIFKSVKEEGPNQLVPKWLEFNQEGLSGKVLAMPTSEDLDFELQYNLIVEFYSK
jgi:CRP-like cAMP-binding protein